MKAKKKTEAPTNGKQENTRELIRSAARELEQRLWEQAAKIGWQKSNANVSRLLDIFPGAHWLEGGAEGASETEFQIALCFSIARDIQVFDLTDQDALSDLCYANNFFGDLYHRINDDSPSKNYFSRLGMEGATARHKAMNDLKVWTLKKYSEGKWASQSVAADDLKDEVIAHGRTIGANLASSNAQRTITKWIRESVKPSGRHV